MAALGQTPLSISILENRISELEGAIRELRAAVRGQNVRIA